MKVHKDGMPICLVVDYTQAPSLQTGEKTDQYPEDTHPTSQRIQRPELCTTHEGHLRNTVRPGFAISFTGYLRYVF